MISGLFSTVAAVAASPIISVSAGLTWQGQRKVRVKPLRQPLSPHSLRVLVQKTSFSRTGSSDIHHGIVHLSDHKLYICSPGPGGHDPAHRLSLPFSGHVIPFPNCNWDADGQGLASFLDQDRTYGTWIYVDRQTYEVKYGEREVAGKHLAGPWSLNVSENRLLLDEWEGFLAVKEGPGLWALYFDVEGKANVLDCWLCGILALTIGKTMA